MVRTIMNIFGIRLLTDRELKRTIAEAEAKGLARSQEERSGLLNLLRDAEAQKNAAFEDVAELQQQSAELRSSFYEPSPFEIQLMLELCPHPVFAVAENVFQQAKEEQVPLYVLDWAWFKPLQDIQTVKGMDVAQAVFLTAAESILRKPTGIPKPVTAAGQLLYYFSRQPEEISRISLDSPDRAQKFWEQYRSASALYLSSKEKAKEFLCTLGAEGATIVRQAKEQYHGNLQQWLAVAEGSIGNSNLIAAGRKILEYQEKNGLPVIALTD